jgi:hypothetical protein
MASEATLDFEEHPFACRYCGKETIVEFSDVYDFGGASGLRTLWQGVLDRERRAEAAPAVKVGGQSYGVRGVHVRMPSKKKSVEQGTARGLKLIPTALET